MDEINDSAVAVVLEELLKSNELSADEYDFLLEEFTALVNSLSLTKAKYLDTSKRTNLANEDIMNQKLLWEKLKIGESDAIRSLKKLEDIKLSTLSEIEASEQQEVISKFELAEIQRIHEELCAELVSLKSANEVIVNPVLKSIQAQISELNGSISENDNILFAENDRKQKLIGSIDDLEKLLNEKSDVLASKIEALSAADNEPNRVSRQIDSMNKALNSLAMEQNIMHRKKDSLDKEILHQKTLQAETEKLKKTLSEKLDVNRKTLQSREHDISAIEISLGNTKLNVHELALQKVELNSQRKAVDNDLRHQMDSYSCAKMEYENLKRFLKKKRIILNSAKEVLPKLKEQNAQALSNINAMKADLGNTRQVMKNLKLEIDQGLIRLIAEENMNADKKNAFDSVLVELDEYESKVKNAINEGRKRRKIISVLNAQRDVKSRECARASAKEREAKLHVKMKELTVLDLTKRCNELSNRLKEFSALFEVVKNERNKYVNLIQNSAQGLAEMKEKIRILTDEIEILSNESAAKDSALSKEKTSHGQVQRQRDTLRQDMNRLLASYRLKQSAVEQQIQEVDKMNMSISKLEKDMISIKIRYERSTEERNIAGIQLVDRNDELCILYERSNHQQINYRTGEQLLRQKFEELRLIRIQSEELRRQYGVARNRLPEVENTRNDLQRLQNILDIESKRSSEISSSLEDPHNLDRWRALGGEDVDCNQLAAKILLLQKKIDLKREKILDQELFLQDINNMTERIRDDAKNKKENSMVLGDQLNSVQSRIREINKKVIATVSELSLYQATALRLQKERVTRDKEYNDSVWRCSNGDPPTDLSQLEFDNILQRRSRSNKASAEYTVSASKFATSAEPRPSAYIPDDIGIPKPYGSMAPFKPTAVGPTFRKLKFMKSADSLTV